MLPIAVYHVARGNMLNASIENDTCIYRVYLTLSNIITSTAETLAFQVNYLVELNLDIVYSRPIEGYRLEFLPFDCHCTVSFDDPLPTVAKYLG